MVRSPGFSLLTGKPPDWARGDGTLIKAPSILFGPLTLLQQPCPFWVGLTWRNSTGPVYWFTFQAQSSSSPANKLKWPLLHTTQRSKATTWGPGVASGLKLSAEGFPPPSCVREAWRNLFFLRHVGQQVVNYAIEFRVLTIEGGTVQFL